MKKIINKQFILLTLVLLIASFTTRFIFIDHPKEVVFDEVHYIGHVNGYITGVHTFSGHPPLGILLIALGAKIGGYNGSTSSKNINDPLKSSLPLRFLPALVGSLIPLAVFVMALVLGASTLVSFLAAMLLVFDNALLVQSKFALIDVFLILFGLLGLICFLVAKKNNFSEYWLMASGIFFGLSISVKWSAAGFILFPILIMSWIFFTVLFRKKYSEALNIFRKAVIWMAIVPVMVYIAVYMVHVSLITQPGPGDAYVSSDFKNEGVLNKIYELNKANYNTNLIMTATHPYSSKFYTWPFLIRPIYYWVKNISPDIAEKIYLVGNPLVWWISTAGLFLALLFWRPERKETKWFLYGAYFSTILPFFFVARVTFLYHYFPSFIIAILITTMWLFEPFNSFKNKKFAVTAALLLLAAFMVFIYYAPLSYGTPLSVRDFHSRVLFNSWQ